MRLLRDQMYLVETAADLPDFRGAKVLYLDFETVSFDPTEGGLNPYKGHCIAGAAITADDCEQAYYVPVRHYHHTAQGNVYQRGMIDETTFQRWLFDQVTTCETWCNANVKFDAHFAAQEGAIFQGRLECLTTWAKVLDSDRTYKGGYGLKALSEAWLGEKITDLEDLLRGYLDTVKLPRNKKAHDYGLIPVDIIAPYACQDVFTARKLRKYILAEMPADCKGALETETLLTPVLFDMERDGLRVDATELDLTEFALMQELVSIEELIAKHVGQEITPSNSNHCYELLVNHWGLPILAFNEAGNPSFDKHALAQYVLHPNVAADEKRSAIVKLMLHYREQHTLLTYFVQPYKEHQVEGLMHSDYNQSVRSGRMSCKRPNAQQLNKAAKSLIHPQDGFAFLSCDYSQIEFRLIVHYTNTLSAIEAYAKNPDEDFHTWMAKMCGISRKPAKTMNFAVGYGAGKNKVTALLASNMELMREIVGTMTPSQFSAACRKRAEEVYLRYHKALPGLKPTSYAAANNMSKYGYVFDAYGRRLHLPPAFAHVAFNRLVQGCAASLMKERTVAVSPRYNPLVRSLGIRLGASVHDETKFHGPKEVLADPRVVSYLVRTLEATPISFRVPIRAGAGYSSSSWAESSADEAKVGVDRALRLPGE